MQCGVSHWLTSIIWAFMIGGLLAYTRTLSACIVAHSVTNLLLGLYVLGTKQWFF
jgi:MFS-type transporter involved in bile tolerance (Atg22 family)